MKTLQNQLENFQEKELTLINKKVLSYSEKWAEFCEKVKKRLSPITYENWIKTIVATQKSQKEIELCFPNIFVKDSLLKNYENEMKEIFKDITIILTISTPKQPVLTRKGISFVENNEKDFFSKAGLKYSRTSFLENFNPQIISENLIKWGYEWAKKPCSIFIHGEVGCGKTFFALSLVRQAYREDKILNAEYFVGTTLDSMGLSAIKSDKGDEQFLEKIKNTEFLFIDDFGRETKSDRLTRQYFEIINHRYSHELPTLITSNLDLNGVALKTDDSISSRIQEWEVIHMTGSDARRFI